MGPAAAQDQFEELARGSVEVRRPPHGTKGALQIESHNLDHPQGTCLDVIGNGQRAHHRGSADLSHAEPPSPDQCDSASIVGVAYLRSRRSPGPLSSKTTMTASSVITAA